MKKILTQNKPFLYGIAVVGLVVGLILEGIVIRLLHMNWQGIQCIGFRLFIDLWTIFLMYLIFDRSKEYEKSKRIRPEKQNSLQRLHWIIGGITVLLCMIDAVRSELATPSRVYNGAGILVAGSVFQFLNYYLRTETTKQKKGMTLVGGVMLIGVALIAPVYQWVELLDL